MIAFSWSGVFDALGWLVIVLALGVAGYRTLSRSEDPARQVFFWIIIAAMILLIRWMIAARIGGPWLPLFILIPALPIGLLLAPSIGRFMVKPVTDAWTGGDDVAELKPFYFVAEGHRRQSQFPEAIAEARKQLEKFPGDVTGYMLVAAIQAEDMRDLPAAAATVEELLALPDLPQQAAASALHAMADWQLQVGRDTEAARVALERIVGLFPDSQFAHAAQQRIARLGGVDEAREFRENAKFEVQSRLRKIGLEGGGLAAPAPPDADALAAEYVKQLEQYPTDTDTREKLAELYAERFGRIDMAAAQLEQLIAIPSETPKHVARWLNLLATLHVRCAKDGPAAEAALRRVIERFPKTAMAEIAAIRLNSLPFELKAGEQTQTKHLGAYEKNLGLKKPGG